MFSHFIVLFIFSVFLATSTYSQTVYKVELLEGNFTLQWSITAPKIMFEVTVQGISWAGIGWHYLGATGADDHKMFDVDFAVAVFDNTVPKLVTDRKSNNAVNTGFTMPLWDQNSTIGGVDNIENGVGTQVNGVTTFSFERALDTGDTKGDWPIIAGTFHVIAARGTSNKFGYHSRDLGHRGHWLIDFFTGANMPCTTC